MCRSSCDGEREAAISWRSSSSIGFPRLRRPTGHNFATDIYVKVPRKGRSIRVYLKQGGRNKALTSCWPMRRMVILTTKHFILLIAPRTSCTGVMENLDHKGFSILDEGAIRLLMSIYSWAYNLYNQFPLHAICESHLQGQLSFLKHAVATLVHTFTFKHSSRNMTWPIIFEEICFGFA